jgi:glycerophosphoryl diester phosphodiesterase
MSELIFSSVSQLLYTIFYMKITGHRGAKGLAPENTLDSFKKAIEHKVDEIECDVRVSADGIPVISHNRHLSDHARNKLNIRKHTYDELKAHKPDLPTMDEAIRAVNRSVPLVLEVKPGEKVMPIVDAIQALLADGWEPKHFLFASFSYKTLRELSGHLPDMPIVVNDRWSGVRASWRARRLGTKRVTMNHRWLWSGFVKAVANGGYQLNAYTLNNPDKAARLAKHGLYGVVTDFPDRYEK